MSQQPKRRSNNAKGRSDLGPPFVRLWHWIVKTEQFAALTGSELKLLIDLTWQFNGSNNGNLSIYEIRARWKSTVTTQKAKNGLLDKGWIICTRKGGHRMGPDLFAVTWLPVNDCDGKHDHPVETRASNAWAHKKIPVPETGINRSRKWNGRFAKNGLPIPENGTELKAA